MVGHRFSRPAFTLCLASSLNAAALVTKTAARGSSFEQSRRGRICLRLGSTLCRSRRRSGTADASRSRAPRENEESGSSYIVGRLFPVKLRGRSGPRSGRGRPRGRLLQRRGWESVPARNPFRGRSDFDHGEIRGGSHLFGAVGKETSSRRRFNRSQQS
jgi:hypothetical protein